MAIKYYPNRIQKKRPPVIDTLMQIRDIKSVSGSQDVSSSALDVIISSDSDWKLNSIKFNFSNATTRDFSAKITGGRKIVTDFNDYLWIQSDKSLPEKITLDSGFYNGDELAIELRTKLDANSKFTSDGITFTVVYDSLTGFYTITPSGGQIRYLNVNKMKTPQHKDSIAGHLFGFTADTSFLSSITSDIEVFGLNKEAWIIDETSSSVTENYFDDTKILSIDEAIHLETSVASTIVDYTVSYERLS